MVTDKNVHWLLWEPGNLSLSSNIVLTKITIKKMFYIFMINKKWFVYIRIIKKSVTQEYATENNKCKCFCGVATPLSL